MKKILLGAVALCLMASCAGNGSSEKAREDSARIADSIAQVEKAKAEAEQARQDSIRQDSIKKIEKAIASIPTFYEFEKNSRRGKFFKDRGFSVVEKYVYVDVDIEYYYDVKATFKPADGISCTFKNDYGGYGGFSITLEGAPEVLNKIYEDAKSFVKSRNKQYRSEGSEETGQVSLKNNTVRVQYFNVGS